MTQSGFVLVVDDDASVRQLLASYLSQEGFEVRQATDGRTALQMLDTSPCDLVISDVRMPGLDGLDLLSEIRRRDAAVPVLMLTACDDVPMAVNAMKLGATDYILKPFDLGDLRNRIHLALAAGASRRNGGGPPAPAASAEDLRYALDENTRQMLRTLHHLDRASEGMLEALVTALDAREHETHSHSMRVAKQAVTLASVMGLSGDALTVVRRGALLHDIGKIGVPDRILLKPGTLTEEEWQVMRRHPEIGARILESVELLRPAAEIVLCHHENYDGSGYPRGLRSESIPLGARVFSLVDSLDAMVSRRSYRATVSYDEAREEIQRCTGTQFDPQVVKVFLALPGPAWLD